MARDRQRSKARQRARAQQEQSGGRKPRRTDAPQAAPDAPDTGLDDATIEDSGLEHGGPIAPGFEHNAEADIVKATEAGAELPDEEQIDAPFEAERTDRAPDEVEIPSGLQRSPRGGRGGGGGGTPAEMESEQPDPRDKDRSKLGAFIAGCIEELRRVQWPDRPAVFQATAVVLGFVLVAGGYLGLMDAIWQPLINAIL